MSVMRINDVQLPDDRPLTVDDLARLPDDGNRYELAYGVLEVSPAPIGDHEVALHRLEFLLELQLPAELMLTRGQGVNLHGDPTRHRIPDTTIVRGEEYESTYQVRPAVLAVEVASPGPLCWTATSRRPSTRTSASSPTGSSCRIHSGRASPRTSSRRVPTWRPRTWRVTSSSAPSGPSPSPSAHDASS